MKTEREETLKKLDEQTLQHHSVQREKDAVLGVLHKHNIPWEDHLTSHVTELQKLQSQNRELHATIKQMRSELEQLSEMTECEREQQQVGEPSVQYITYLENDVCKLKSKNRQLAERLAQVSKPPTPRCSQRQAGLTSPGVTGDQQHPASSATVAAVSSGEGSAVGQLQQQHREQLIALSDTIACVQREKGQLEREREEWRDKAQLLQDQLTEEKEMVCLWVIN